MIVCENLMKKWGLYSVWPHCATQTPNGLLTILDYSTEIFPPCPKQMYKNLI